MAVSWEHTESTLSKLKRSVCCSACNNLLKDPCSLSTCHHEFCRECIVDGTKCPQCGVPYWKKDITPFKQLNTLVQHIESLERLIMTPLTRSRDTSIVLRPKNHRWARHNVPVQTRLSLKRKRRLSEGHDKEEENSKENTTKERREEESEERRKGEREERRGAIMCLSLPPAKLVSIKRNSVGETKLHVAVIKGDISLVRRLLKEGADPNVTDNAGWTPLHEACNHGYREIVDLLISGGSLLNVPGYNNDTPLHDAVQNNHPDVVAALVRAGAKTQLRNCQGHTPMDLAHTTLMRTALSSLPAVKDSTVSPARLTMMIKSCPVILGSGLTPYQRALLTKTANRMGARVVHTFTSQVTHVVTECDEESCCSRTLKCLSAVAIGAWLLNFQWLVESSKQCSWQKETDYLIQGFNYQGQSHITGAPWKGYINAMEKLPGLFDGCSFHFIGRYISPHPSKEELVRLVQYAGGTVLTREPKQITENDTIFDPYPFHAPAGSVFSTCHTFIITASSSPSSLSNDTSLLYSRTLSMSWILDCLCQFELVDFTK